MTQPEKRLNHRAYAYIQNLKEDLGTQAEQDALGSPAKARSGRRDSNSEKRFGMFQNLVQTRFRFVVQTFDYKELSSIGIKSATELSKEAHLFEKVIDKAFDLAARNITGRKQNPYFWNWRNAFVTGDTRGLHNELKYSFTSFSVRQHLSKSAIAIHEKLADFRHPHEWFPATRTMQRTIHLHVGPTNSGKTYNALKALENSKSGIYAGPLRLLAHETFMRFKAKGKRCALVTGEEQRIPEGDEGYFASCTVEMTPLNSRVDVAVIDEIQMIGDEQRGWAWTQAVLGVQAKEVHLCGEERAVQLVQALCAKTGDEVIVHRYERLSALRPMQESLGGRFHNLRKGDAVVSFSRIGLHGLKKGIEEATGKKCAIVYGALPPETRAQQAALFNDPNNDYDFLAASDAIGMGLNLEIRRVVFESVTKHDGVKVRTLTIPELKQIGGRAGRYRTAAQAMQETSLPQPQTTATDTEDAKAEAVQPFQPKRQDQVGFVTTLEEEDLDPVHESFYEEAEPLRTAGLLPPTTIIEKFASYFPEGTPLTFMLLRLRDIGRLPERFHMCSFQSQLEVAGVIQRFPMSIHDRCIFLTAPVSFRDYKMAEVLKALASRVSENKSGDLLDIKEINLEILDYTRENYPPGKSEYLKHLESLHRALTLYLWLSYRYTGIFQSQALAFHVKEIVEERINEYLEQLDYQPEDRRKRLASARKAVSKRRDQAKKVFGDEMDELEALEQGEGPSAWSKDGEEGPVLNEISDADITDRSPNATI